MLSTLLISASFQQTEESIKAIQDFQVQIGERIARIESKIDDNAAEVRGWMELQKNSGNRQYCRYDEARLLDHSDPVLPNMAENIVEDSFDLFQDIGAKARELVLLLSIEFVELLKLSCVCVWYLTQI